MKAFVKDIIYLVVAAAIILPTPTLVFAYMTNKTVWEVIYR